MSPDSDEVLRLFRAIADLTPSDRREYLDLNCPDQDMRAELEQMISDYDASAVLYRDVGTSQPAEAVSMLDPGVRLDEFEIIEQVGVGGMAVVYLAEDTVLEREVALKVLVNQVSRSAIRLARFENEAKAIAKLNHPAIVPVYRVGEDGGVHYIAMEFIRGNTLASLVEQRRREDSAQRRSTLSTQLIREEASRLAMIADALDHAHVNGVIHRDIKPSNILIRSDGQPCLADFGIAKVSEEDLTHTGEVAGTTAYMSPEQASARLGAVDLRTDIFSLGVVLYEVATLQLPFYGRSPQEVLAQICSSEPRHARGLNAAIPRDLDTIIHKAMEKRPEDRYQTAAHLAADLRCFVSGRPILAKPPSLMRRLRLWIRRHKTLAVSAAFVGLLAIMAGLVVQEVDRRRAQLCLVGVSSEPAGAAVYVQRFDDSTLELGDAVRLGTTPLSGERLPPGLHRFTVVAPNGDFAEMTQWLTAGTSVNVEAPILPTAQVSTGMILFAAGDYRFGWLNDATDLNRERWVQLPAFLLDATEVTNAEYAAFVEATGHPPPPYWTVAGYPPELADHPVVAVSQQDAERYARWCGKRLPTIFEWEGAARAPDGRKFPWGDQPPPSGQALTVAALQRLKSHDRATLYELYAQWTLPVRSQPEWATSMGLYHMFGNVREWTANIRGQRGQAVMFKGQSWAEDPAYVDLTVSNMQPRQTHSYRIGFRCAKSAPPVFSPD